MDRHARLGAAIPGYAPGTAVSLPGIWDGLSAQLVEKAGFGAAFLSGGALAMARHGRPDIGLVTLSELAITVGLIREISDLPLVVDADTGFGNALNARRTMRMLENAGASAVQLEDQVFPKRCGHLAGKAIIPCMDYVGKLKAVLDVRRSASTLVIARTDARSVEGFGPTMERAHAYTEAGADLLFIEGPQNLEEMQEIGRVFGPHIPLVHNLVEGAVNPISGRAELGALGYAIGLHPLLLLHGFIRSAPHWLDHLAEHGSTTGLGDALADLGAFNHLLGTAAIISAAQRYE